ncbi:hypothetical protein [Streptomyces sp. G45]|uniref:hypothetical protein n=1 Tax=Streptomyces sp. G45 TaxID=3406627 RepID=UPI003C1C1F8C
MLPVLDGFDELPTTAHGHALRRLNAELDERLPVLLTCRTEAWTRAVRDGDVLTAAEVVQLRPLDLASARAYLESTARPDGHGATVWTPVLAAPSPQLLDVLAAPLMVALARAVYGDTSRDPGELLDTARFPTAARIEEHLLDAFVPAAFHDTHDTHGTWSPEAAHRWLRRLARDLGQRRPGRTGTWRLAWWELPTAMPRALRLVGPAFLAVAATAALLLPVAVYGDGVVGYWGSPLSAVLHQAGEVAGLCFGLALLPATAGTPQGPRRLVRLVLALTSAATACEVLVGLTRPRVNGFRVATVADSGLMWFLNGFGLALTLVLTFAVAGLPRRPLPLGLPWAGSPGGPRAVRALAAVVAFAGLALFAFVGDVLPVLTCLVAGLLLYLAGLRRGERVTAHDPGPGALLRGFARGFLKGFGTCLLIAVASMAFVGAVAGAFAAREIHTAALPATGDVVGDWRLRETADGDRSVRSVRPYRGELLERPGFERPIAVHRGAWFSYDWPRRTPFDRTVEIRRGGQGWEIAEGLRHADAHNLVLGLPRPVQLWLAHRPVTAIVLDTMTIPLAVGALMGVIGGCASGVYRALSIPSDTMRAASPQSTLRTDRAATLARSAIAAVLTGGVCLALISVLGSGGPLGTLHTELWVPVGTSALALSAWGRLGPARVWLALTGRAPWRLMRFLEDAHRRGVLRQSGAHYEFRHLRLQQRLAAAADDPPTPDP